MKFDYNVEAVPMTYEGRDGKQYVAGQRLGRRHRRDPRPRAAGRVRLAGPVGFVPVHTTLAFDWVIAFFVAFGIALSGLGGSSVEAQTPSDANIASGMRIYRQKADCQACHGWAGDGRKMDSQMPDGANLRTSQLSRDQTIFVIKCGLPGPKHAGL